MKLGYGYVNRQRRVLHDPGFIVLFSQDILTTKYIKTVRNVMIYNNKHFLSNKAQIYIYFGLLFQVILRDDLDRYAQ